MFRNGNIPWNKGKVGVQVSWNKGKKLSIKMRNNMSDAHFKGGDSVYWAHKLKKICKYCSMCHSHIKIEMHHKDKDRKNHKRINLIILCRECHEFWHYT